MSRHSSIRLRLTAWYCLVFGAGLTFFSTGTWFAMRASLFHAADSEILDRARGIQRFLKEQYPELSTPDIQRELQEHSGLGADLFQVCDQDGNWLYRSAPLESNHVPIRRPAQLPSPIFETLEISQEPLRVYSERVSIGNHSYSVQAALPMHEAFEALERFRALLLLTLPLLLAASGIGGYWMSKRALAPVDKITHTARRISIENLSDRLPVPSTGDELERLSQTLNEMFARLDRSVQRITEFTADASHELRAPVTLIRTTAETALRKERSPGEYPEAVTSILRESERTSQVVDSLMFLARADSGAEDLDLSAIDLGATVREAAEQGEKLAAVKNIRFCRELPEGPLKIQGDADTLRRLLVILIDNAVKYTPEGGRVTLKVESRDGLAITAVEDSGIGIAEEDLPRIFERFWRADKARSREQGGAGLGLSIAKWIATAHHGRIEVSSSLGHGSTFTVKLPLAK